MPIKVKPFDAAKYFATDDDQIDLISDALESRHAGYIAAAIGAVARARGMSAVASEANLSRQALYSALSDDGNPTLDTVLKVLDVLGLDMKIERRQLEDA